MGIALFGGSFNPIHMGHISFAQEAIKLPSVSDIYFIPAFVSPFKEGEEAAAPEARLEMVTFAVESFEHFRVLDIEIRRGGKSFTIDTVKEIMEFFPEEEISLMIGEDAFKDIEKWYEADELLKMVDLIIMVRPGGIGEANNVPFGGLAQLVESMSGFCYDENSKVITSSYGRDVVLITENLSDVSSTSVREKVRNGRPVDELVPKKVAKYIKANCLYK